MKNFIKFPQMLGAVLLLSCTTDVQPDKQAQAPVTPTVGVVEPSVTPNNNFTDVLPSMYPFSDNAHFIKGQLSASSNLNMNTLFVNKMATPNLGDIVKTGEKINMVAMGGGMTAGVRNGGLYRAGQMTAYPNLVARQMGITDFQSPLFAENEANGTGYLQLVDDGTQYPSWKEVSNSKVTVKAGSPPELPKFAGGAVNNYALPEGSLEIIGRPVENKWGLAGIEQTWGTSQIFSSRMLANATEVTTTPLRDKIFKQPINFYLIEDDFDVLLAMIKYNANALSSYGYQKSMTGPTMLYYTIDLMKDRVNASKGVIFTYPFISDLAYFNWYSIQDLKNKAKAIQINTSRNNESFTLDGTQNNFLLLPTPAVDALFRNLKKGDNVSLTLADTDILDPSEFLNNTVSFKLYNDKIREIAKNRGLALVDLEKIYSQIHTNTYISADGFKIDGGTKGNFFSADGIYPTAIGQALIANEVIKSINATYKSTIPLINLKDYSLTVGKE
jgi:hypothetical protein